MQGTTAKQEREILASPTTHRLVREILELSEGYDPVDAFYDAYVATTIIKGRMNRLLQGAR